MDQSENNTPSRPAHLAVESSFCEALIRDKVEIEQLKKENSDYQKQLDKARKDYSKLLSQVDEDQEETQKLKE